MPFEDRQHNYKEIFNEIMTLLVAINVICFTDFVTKVEGKITMGVSLIYLIAFNILVNFI